MFLGDETVSVNGTLSVNDTNLEQCFMVCDGATALFNPGSALTGGGAMVVGNEDAGTLVATGTASKGTTLSANAAQIGRFPDGVGNVTFNDAAWNISTTLMVGLEGSGTLSVTHGGVVTVPEVMVAPREGSTGDIALTNGGTLNATTSLSIGSLPTNQDGSGSGTITVDATSLIKVGTKMIIQPDQSLALSGGSLVMGPQAEDVDIVAGGTLSGYGTVSALAGGISDYGTISASGGTLVLDGDVHYNGVLAIGAASTAFVDGAALGHIAVEFTGAAGTLELATGITSDAKIYDFAAGDSIVMAGVNGIALSGATDVLNLKETGHVIDKLQLVGSYMADQITISQITVGAVIGLTAGH